MQIAPFCHVARLCIKVPFFALFQVRICLRCVNCFHLLATSVSARASWVSALCAVSRLPHRTIQLCICEASARADCICQAVDLGQPWISTPVVYLREPAARQCYKCLFFLFSRAYMRFLSASSSLMLPEEQHFFSFISLVLQVWLLKRTNFER